MRTRFDRLREAAAHEPYPAWAVRKRRLEALFALLHDAQDLLADAVAIDFGHRSHAETKLLEIFPSLEAIRHALRHGASWMRDESRRRWTGILAVIVVGFLSVAFVKSSTLPAKEIATTVAVAGGGVQVAAADLADGRMHFYEADLPAGHVRFFAVKDKDQLHTCLDACEICGDKGYFLEGDHAVCRNCTSPIPLASLGRTGGCNPIPLPSRTEAGALWIKAEDLERLIPKQKGR